MHRVAHKHVAAAGICGHTPSDANLLTRGLRDGQAVLEFRLAYPAAKWRNVYKALTVLEFLLKRGSDACVAIARDDMMFRLDHLARNFDYFGPEGRDHGINVRHRRVGEPHFVQRNMRRAPSGHNSAGGTVMHSAPCSELFAIAAPGLTQRNIFGCDWEWRCLL